MITFNCEPRFVIGMSVAVYVAAVSVFVAATAYFIQQTSLPIWQAFLFALLLSYIPSYLEPCPMSPDGRYWPWFATRDWRWLSPFVKKAELHFEAPLVKGTQYLFAVHPHGIASWHHGVLLANSSSPAFSDFVPGDKRRHLGASIVFRIPLWREFMLYFGVVDASKQVANAVLQSGKTLVILVGGVIEQMMAKRGEHLIYVKQRKGTKLIKSYHHVFGNPIPTTKAEHPTQDDIDAVHKQYVDELERIFHKYKAKFGCPDAVLHVAVSVVLKENAVLERFKQQSVLQLLRYIVEIDFADTSGPPVHWNYGRWCETIDTAKAYSIEMLDERCRAMRRLAPLFYIVRVYAAPLRLEYITSVFSLVDLIGVASAWIEISFTQHTLTMLKLDTAGRQFLSMLQVMKSMRVLRAYRLLRFTSSIVQRQILATVLTVLCMIIAVAGALQNVELCPAQCPDFCIPHYRDDVLTCSEIEITFPNTNLTTWCTSFVNYTLASPHPPTNCCRRASRVIVHGQVTISTLGYGDISPKTSAGRIGTSILIMMTFVFLPIQVNTLVSVISQHSKYNKAFTSRSDTHGVITAHELDVGMLHAFLRQFFHPQNRNWNERIVILHPQEPTPDVTKIIHQFEPRVTYIVGSAMQESDLKRAAVPTSSVCYVLTSASGDKTGRADQMSAILTTAFRVMNKTVPIFTQVIASTSVSYCTISGANNVVCVQKLKMSMLALSCRIKGLTTLLTNLLSTLAPPLKPPKDAWMTDYLEGAMSKIFRVDIPRSFSGITYHELVMFLYNNLQVIPIAMETGTNSIQLNPMSFKLGQAADPKLCCTVYVIAPGVEVVDRINEYQLEQIRQFRQTLRKMERAKADAEDSDRVKPVQSPKRQTKKLTLGGHMFKSKTDDVAGSDLKVAYDQFMEVPSVLSRHIVIVGLPYELQDLLGPLRAKSTSQIVVIFAPTKMSIADFERLTHPDHTYFALGSPLSSFDLQRVSITSAASVIVLSTSGTCNSPSTVEFFDKNMVDADAITCVRFILEGCSRHHKHPPNLIVDLAKHTNVRFLSMAVKRESRRDRRVTDHQPGVDDGAYSDMEFATNESDDVLDMNHICEPAYASGATPTLTSHT
ncbi:hypothetical protein DYB32_006303 [Aphanomyces invadans]|uniref:Diacylglycerol O-acyltransferase n=1 Tax=Aphanomyces invadans TaxID=157072 RepID=A0A3R6VJR0_9STRA|nr:hypothetical protein DYB32_006303 [Aphanomyces invadans]